MDRRAIIVALVAVILVGGFLVVRTLMSKNEQTTEIETEPPKKEETEHIDGQGDPVPNTEELKDPKDLIGRAFIHGNSEEDFEIKYFADKNTLYSIVPSEEEVGYETILEKYKIKDGVMKLTPLNGEKYECAIAMKGTNIVLYEEVEYEAFPLSKTSEVCGRKFDGKLGEIWFLDDAHLVMTYTPKKGKPKPSFMDYQINGAEIIFSEPESELIMSFEDKGNKIILDGETYKERK